jgi:hypothetical protein
VPVPDGGVLISGVPARDLIGISEKRPLKKTA